MSDMVTIGVVGAGVFGAHHASKYAASQKAALTAVFDTDLARARNLGARFDVYTAETFPELLDKAGAVVIASPATTHYDLARQALTAGRHVFVEKPLALRPEDADALVAIADERGLVLQVGHQERYVAAAFGLFDRNVGPVKVDCIRNAASSGRCEDVSVIFDLMVHDFDLVRQLTGSHPHQIIADGDEDEARASITMENGATASFAASRRAPSLERRMKLVYEDGVIEIDFVNRSVVNTTSAKLQNGFEESDAPLSFTDPLGYGAELFIDAVRSGEAPVVAGRDGRDAVTWAHAVEDAASIGVNSAYSANERMLA